MTACCRTPGCHRPLPPRESRVADRVGLCDRCRHNAAQRDSIARRRVGATPCWWCTRPTTGRDEDNDPACLASEDGCASQRVPARSAS